MHKHIVAIVRSNVWNVERILLRRAPLTDTYGFIAEIAIMFVPYVIRHSIRGTLLQFINESIAVSIRIFVRIAIKHSHN
jgi:hypothetical protein